MTAGIAARKIGQELGDLQIETRTLNLIGCVHFAKGDRSSSAQILRACVVTAQQVGYRYMEAMAQSIVCIGAWAPRVSCPATPQQALYHRRM